MDLGTELSRRLLDRFGTHDLEPVFGKGLDPLNRSNLVAPPRR
jgi:hypothetical protein